MHKMTTEEVKNEFIKRGFKPLFKEYKNSKTKLLAQSVEGYKFLVTIIEFKRSNPLYFHTSNPYTIENIKLYLNLINSIYKLVSTEYLGTHKNLVMNCPKHGNCKITWHNLQHKNSGQGCKMCAIERKNLNINIIKERLLDINPNIEILSKDYINARIKLTLRCKIDNYIFKTNWGDLSTGRGCPECKNRSHTGENNFNWKGGITPLHEYLRHKILPWKKDSMKNCNYKCDITGCNFDVIHHHYNFIRIIQEVISILNLPIYDKVNKYTISELKQMENLCLKLHYKYGLGVCLTETMHKEFHSIYGKENNTKEQYDEFKKVKTSTPQDITNEVK